MVREEIKRQGETTAVGEAARKGKRAHYRKQNMDQNTSDEA